MQAKSFIYLLVFDSINNHHFVETVHDRRRRPAYEIENLSIIDQGRFADMKRKATRMNALIQLQH